MILIGSLALAQGGRAQQAMLDSAGNPAQVRQADLAVLDGIHQPEGLPCEVASLKTFLGFDLRFHLGYRVSCRGEEITPLSRLAIVFRVTPKNGDAQFFFQHLDVPDSVPIEGVRAVGAVDVGAGEYRVDWLIRDPQGRARTASWETKTEKVEDAEALMLWPGSVGVIGAKADRASRLPNGTVMHALVNVSPQNDGSGILRELDRIALYSMIQAIKDDSGDSSLRITVFQLDARKILFEEKSGSFELNQLVGSVERGATGTISLDALSGETTTGDFAAELLARTQTDPAEPVPVVWIGSVGQSTPGKLDETKLPKNPFPLVYLNYEPRPVPQFRDDPVHRITKLLKGTRFQVQQPRDFLKSWKLAVAAFQDRGLKAR